MGSDEADKNTTPEAELQETMQRYAESVGFIRWLYPDQIDYGDELEQLEGDEE